jgi:hypothetical protein
MMAENVPRSGTASEVAGDISERMLRKKQIERSTVISTRENPDVFKSMCHNDD